MPLYTPTTLEKGLRALFLREMNAASANTLIGAIASMETSAAASEKYIHLGQPPQMEEFKGEVNYGDMTEAGYEIVNVQYVGGIAVRRKDLMNDQTGGIQTRIRQLANVAAHHADKLGILALVNGTSATAGLCYDGVSMFNDSHPARKDEGAVQDNLLAGTGTTTATVLADVNTAFEYFGNVKAENGEPYFGDMQPSELTFVFPWKLIGAFKEVTGAKDISGTTNVILDGVSVRLVPSGRLYKESADANDWYALYTGGAVKPLVYQVREGVTFAALEGNGSDDAFDKEIYKYKASAYHAVKYGPWQAACKFVNT